MSHFPSPKQMFPGLRRRLEGVCAREIPGRPSTRERLRQHILDERGVSVIELLVSMAVMLIILSALSTVAVEASNSQVRTNNRFQAQIQGRLAMDKLRRELHCANGLTVVNSAGTAVAAGTAGRGVYVTLGGYCPTNGLTSTASATVYVTWCTLASTLRSGTFALYRLASLSSQQACATSGVKWADYLTAAQLFCLPNTSTACGGVFKSADSLPTLKVTIPVNLNGASSTSSSFRLVDDIALRNSPRS